jgi:hypothetical protein
MYCSRRFIPDCSIHIQNPPKQATVVKEEKGKGKHQIYHIGNHMASPQKQKNRDMAVGKKVKSQYRTDQCVRYRGATPTPVEGMQFLFLSFVIFGRKMKESVVVSSK